MGSSASRCRGTIADDGMMDAYRKEWSWWKRKRSLTSEQVTALVLLYTKGCLAAASPSERKMNFSCVIGASDERDARWQRLRRVVGMQRQAQTLHAVDMAACCASPSWQTFDKACTLETLSVWRHPHSWVFFKQSAYVHLQAQRQQALDIDYYGSEAYFGSFFGHAAILVGFYILGMNRVRLGHMPSLPTQVDLGAYFLAVWSPQQLWTYINSGACGHSVDFLLALVGLSLDATYTLNASALHEAAIAGGGGAADIASLLQKYGPALVSAMDLSDMLDDTIRSHDRWTKSTSVTASGEAATLISVALVGFRVDNMGTYWFLGQHAMRTKQFFEFNMQCLIDRGACVTFITNGASVVDWADGVPTTAADTRFVECAIFGALESLERGLEREVPNRTFLHRPSAIAAGSSL